MANSTAMRGCGCDGTSGGSGSALLPATPFYAPRYHFGMLLGVDDFESEQAYHRGKMRLHNSWLHGEGAVWGLQVDAPLAEGGAGLKGEIRVLPGLALDAAGREIFLAATSCVSLPAWYQAHADDPELKAVVTEAEDGTIVFDAHVVARFRACLSRQVPAISEPCVGSGGDTAYSRAQETAELLLVPGLAPARSYPYHRLRLLFALDQPLLEEDGVTPVAGDQAVIDARQDILALATDQQPAGYLAALRRFAALDEIDRAPAVTEDGRVLDFPADDDCWVVLADVAGITLAPDGAGGLQLNDARVDVTVRPTLVATATIQELVCGPLFAAVAGPAPEAALPEGDAGGPRVDPTTVTLEGEAISFATDTPLSKASVARDALFVTAYDKRDGWREVEIARDPILDRSGRRVRIELSSTFGGNLVRVTARGTGTSPILGTNLIPLAGVVGGPPGGAHAGHDFVFMLKRSET